MCPRLDLLFPLTPNHLQPARSSGPSAHISRAKEAGGQQRLEILSFFGIVLVKASTILAKRLLIPHFIRKNQRLISYLNLYL